MSGYTGKAQFIADGIEHPCRVLLVVDQGSAGWGGSVQLDDRSAVFDVGTARSTQLRIGAREAAVTVRGPARSGTFQITGGGTPPFDL